MERRQVNIDLVVHGPVTALWSLGAELKTIRRNATIYENPASESRISPRSASRKPIAEMKGSLSVRGTRDRSLEGLALRACAGTRTYMAELMPEAVELRARWRGLITAIPAQ